MQPSHPRSIGIARATTSTFSKKYDRQAQLGNECKEPIFFDVIQQALRTSKNGVVVGNNCTWVAVDGGNSSHQAIARSISNEVFQGATLTLSSDSETAEFLE